jgi:catechol 2,3-dioxygenase-like lactoylglutathione lyase family enzyme
MLEHSTVVATIAVKNMAASRKFYEEKLGLKPIQFRDDDVVTYQSGDSIVHIYKSPYASRRDVTAATWYIDADIETIVEELQRRGVEFEFYDGVNGMKFKEGLVHEAFSDLKVAWVRDPDGNLLALVSDK